MKKQTFSIKTLGCKLNQYESALIVQQLLQAGFEEVHFSDEADIVIINTCTVTDRSDKKCRNYIRQGVKHSKNGMVLVTGCMVNNDPKEVLSIPGVKAVYLNSEKDKLVSDLVNKYSSTDFTEINNLYLKKNSRRSRASLKIQDGCDGKCSYCIIPTVRGIPESRPYDEILENIRILVDEGTSEIVFTGITIGKYNYKGKTLSDLMEDASQISGKFRIRITSIEPLHINDDIIQMYSNPKICSHIHLPAQSGCDEILHQMNRPYNTFDYINIVEKLRAADPLISIGTDLIIGFPGETENHFDETLDFIEKVSFSYVHQFTFSPRKGTPAAERNDFCNPSDVQRRSKILREKANLLRKKYNSKFLGETLEAVIEKNNNYVYATTDNYIKTNIEIHDPDLVESGVIKPVKIIDVNDPVKAVILGGDKK